jgi:hypothetical protein
MIDSPQITQSAAQLAAVIRITIPRAEIQNVMGPGMQEVMATIGSGPLGVLRRRPGVEPRPRQLAHGAQPTVDRLRPEINDHRKLRSCVTGTRRRWH